MPDVHSPKPGSPWMFDHGSRIGGLGGIMEDSPQDNSIGRLFDEEAFFDDCALTMFNDEPDLSNAHINLNTIPRISSDLDLFGQNSNRHLYSYGEQKNQDQDLLASLASELDDGHSGLSLINNNSLAIPKDIGQIFVNKKMTLTKPQPVPEYHHDQFYGTTISSPAIKLSKNSRLSKATNLELDEAEREQNEMNQNTMNIPGQIQTHGTNQQLPDFFDNFTIERDSQNRKILVEDVKNPWPSANEYVEIFKDFLKSPSKYVAYNVARLGRCKLTGTPLQPEWLYKCPKAGIYFLECGELRGKGSFGFPKCATLRKKCFEWKKTSYVNNVPKAKPVISYITANGHGVYANEVHAAFRMRIIKPINLSCQNAQLANKWVLVDIHVSDGLARRKGPRNVKKSPPKEATNEPADNKKPTDTGNNRNNKGSNSKPIQNSKSAPPTPHNERSKTKSTQSKSKTKNMRKLTLNTKIELGLQKTVPLSPMKRLSLSSNVDEPSQIVESPKGRKMQRMSKNNHKVKEPTEGPLNPF